MVIQLRKLIYSKKGEAALWIMIFVFIFVMMTTLIFDFGVLYLKARKIKYSVNQSVKAGALAIQENEHLADGYFLIEPTEAEANFNNVLAGNLGLYPSTLDPIEGVSILDSSPVIKEFEVINVHPEYSLLIGDPWPGSYYSPTIDYTYDVEYPSVVGIVEFEITGLFSKRTIKVAKLSSSQLSSTYD